MPDPEDTNKRTPSTTWEWRKVKISRRPPGPQHSGRRPPSKALSRRSPRESLTITIRHRGGAESWWEVRARGLVWRRPGYVALDDLLQQIYAGEGGKELPAAARRP